MVELQCDDKVSNELEGVTVESVADSEEYSSDESITTIADDDDLTTDGCRGRALALGKTEEAPTFGTVSVNNSTDIHFGNKTFYHGPVTIKQFVYAGANAGEATEDSLPAGVKTEVLSRAPLPAGVKTEVLPRAPLPDPNAGNTKDWKLCLGRAARRRQYVALLLAATVAVLITMATLLIIFFTADRQSDKEPSTSRRYDREPPYESTYHEHTLSPTLRILLRRDWLAEPPRAKLNPLPVPVPYVIISHTATENCSSQAQCVHTVRTVQTFHIESKNWSDIGYNFLVGGDGYVYSGRGWDTEGAHAYGYNRCSIGISFMGTFVLERPPPRQMVAAMQLIEEGVRLGKIRRNYMLLAHRQVSATESPGQVFYDDIKKLPHWLKNPMSCDVAMATVNP